MDDNDFLIVKHMINNPKISLSELGKLLQLSVTSISKRVKKLEKENIIKYNLAVNINKIKFSHSVLLISTNDFHSKTKIINHLHKCPIVELIFNLTDTDYDLLIYLLAPDQNDIQQFVQFCPIMSYGSKKVKILQTSNPNITMFLPILKSEESQLNGTDQSCDCEHCEIQCKGCPLEELKIPVSNV